MPTKHRESPVELSSEEAGPSRKKPYVRPSVDPLLGIQLEMDGVGDAHVGAMIDRLTAAIAHLKAGKVPDDGD